jgi:hypothetical protein
MGPCLKHRQERTRLLPNQICNLQDTLGPQQVGHLQEGRLKMVRRCCHSQKGLYRLSLY